MEVDTRAIFPPPPPPPHLPGDKASSRMHGWLFGWVWWTQQSLPRSTGALWKIHVFECKIKLAVCRPGGFLPTVESPVASGRLWVLTSLTWFSPTSFFLFFLHIHSFGSFSIIYCICTSIRDFTFWLSVVSPKQIFFSFFYHLFLQPGIFRTFFLKISFTKCFSFPSRHPLFGLHCMTSWWRSRAGNVLKRMVSLLL